MHQAFTDAVSDLYLGQGKSARYICTLFDGIGVGDVYHCAARLRRAGLAAASRDTVQQFNAGRHIDASLYRELIANGASEAEVAAYFNTTPNAVRAALRSKA